MIQSNKLTYRSLVWNEQRLNLVW